MGHRASQSLVDEVRLVGQSSWVDSGAAESASMESPEKQWVADGRPFSWALSLSDNPYWAVASPMTSWSGSMLVITSSRN